MKVTVKRVAPIMYKHPRLQAEFEEAFYAHQLTENLIQENKDLRVQEGHLHDDLACANSRIKNLEALVEELNAQIDASESDVKFWKKAASENAEIAASAQHEADDWERSAHEHAKQVTAMQATIDRLEAQIVSMGKKNDGISAELAWFKAKAEEATAELALHEMGHYKRECDEWKVTADELAEKCAKFKDERDEAWREVKRLMSLEDEVEKYRDLAARRKDRADGLIAQNHELEEALAELRQEHAELGEDYDALVQTKRDYGEEIDRLRKVVTDLQTNRFTLEEIFVKILGFTENCERIVPSTDQ